MANRKLAKPLTSTEIAELRRVVGADSTFGVAQRLGISAHTLTRGIAGVGLRAGTACQIRIALSMLAAQEPTP
jgi:hypothetical protein